MVKKTKTCEIAVAVSRFGHDPLPVCVMDGETVGDVLAKAGITLEGREKIYVAGAEATLRDEVEGGDVLSVVTPKQAGIKKADENGSDETTIVTWKDTDGEDHAQKFDTAHDDEEVTEFLERLLDEDDEDYEAVEDVEVYSADLIGSPTLDKNIAYE